MSELHDLIAAGTPLQIPVLEGAGYQRQRIILDGRQYTLGLSWNQFGSFWTLSLWDAEESAIVLGVRVNTNWPILRYYRYDPRTPRGELMALDLAGYREDREAATVGESAEERAARIDLPAPVDPGFDDFGIGKRVELIYFSLT